MGMNDVELIARYQQDPKARFFHEAPWDPPLALSAAEVLHESRPVRMHDSLQRTEALVADVQVIAHVHEHARLEQRLGGAQGPGQAREVRERLRGPVRPSLLLLRRRRAYPELDNQRLQQRKVRFRLLLLRWRR